MKNLEKIELVAKGIANKRRIAILFLLVREPKLDLELIAGRLNFGYKSTAEHLRKMHLAGLIEKEYEGSYVLHATTNRGKKIAAFLLKLS